MTALVRWADRLVRAAAVFTLLAMLACVVLGVVFRQLGDPLAWSDELAQYLLVWTGFVGWVLATRRRTHIRITVLADMLPRLPRAALEIAVQLGVIAFAAVLVQHSFALIERTWDVESVSLPLTAAFLYLPMPVAGLALALQAFADIAEVVLGARRPAAPPEGALPL